MIYKWSNDQLFSQSTQASIKVMQSVIELPRVMLKFVNEIFSM